MTNESCAKKIAELRKQRGMSQRELADYMGISNRAVSKWENELSYPTTENFVKLTNIFNVPMDYFFSDKNKSGAETKDVGMESLKELYKIGTGPSSSHTMGPEKAVLEFKQTVPDADSFICILYGSLAKTGKGHGTDIVVQKTFAPAECEIRFNYSETNLPHPNTMELIALKNNKEIKKVRILSVGGGSIRYENSVITPPKRIYTLDSFKDISEYCKSRRIPIWQYAFETEGSDFYNYMLGIWNAMKTSVENGLADDGILPGGLGVNKKAKYLYNYQHIDESAETRENRIVCSYAFAVSEQNASLGKVVTAPTCGAAGVLPAVLYYQQQKNKRSDEEIIHALTTGGIIGNLIKTNASISGAECGCQAEIGSACAMAAAALGELHRLNMDSIEYAAEIAIEHHLGLTCDPINGLVQIPCIERNAVAAMRAINAVNLASFLSETRKISLDKVIIAMKETGRDLKMQYRETAEGGLASIMNRGNM